jgi:hypothetical protein
VLAYTAEEGVRADDEPQYYSTSMDDEATISYGIFGRGALGSHLLIFPCRIRTHFLPL